LLIRDACEENWRVGTRPQNVSANGEEADWQYEEGRLMVSLTESAGETTVEVRV
jgi:hypothetical protein